LAALYVAWCVTSMVLSQMMRTTDHTHDIPRVHDTGKDDDYDRYMLASWLSAQVT